MHDDIQARLISQNVFEKGDQFFSNLFLQHVLPNDMLFDELESFTGGRSTAYLKDDLVDNVSDGFAKLATNKELPNFNGALLRL